MIDTYTMCKKNIYPFRKTRTTFENLRVAITAEQEAFSIGKFIRLCAMRKTGLLITCLLLITMLAAQTGIEKYFHKLSPSVQKEYLSKTTHKETTYWISVSDIDSLLQFIQDKKLPAKIIRRESLVYTLVVVCQPSVIEDLLTKFDGIRFIDIPRLPKEELSVNKFDNTANAINIAHRKYAAVNGSNMVLSVKENRYDTTDIDFKGRHLPSFLSSPILSTHASIMATLAAGGGNSFYTGKGVAWAAGISSSNFANLLPDTLAYYQQNNISVQNHSYGTGIENYYGIDAAAYDAITYSNPHLLHVFSAGNSGSSSSTQGVFSGVNGFANLTGSFKMSKNSLSVGATDSFGIVAQLSSRGPAYDGRIKPELVALGEDGSSGAAALTSGTALLLQQYLQQKSGGLPPASLIKAILINSADDIGISGPDYHSGFGALNAFKALQTIADSNYRSGNVQQGNSVFFPVTVPNNVKLLKITLCWNDPPAIPNTPKALVNDLDLLLVNTSNSASWRPWVLSKFPNRDSLLLPAIRTRDSLNNVEQITVQGPVGGNYQIRISGTSVVQGPQDFSIALQFDSANEFTWYHPVLGDQLTGGTTNVLRWRTAFLNSNSKLEYSFDKGNSWKLISNNVNLSDNYYKWMAPDTTSTIQFRMTINNSPYLSETATISKPVTVKVGFNCNDSVLLYWNKTSHAVTYNLYKLGSTYLQPIAAINDSFAIVSNSGENGSQFTVAPKIDPVSDGIKAYTINVNTQGVGCYIKNFFADLENNNTARISIELGTIYRVNQLAIEKKSSPSFESWQTINNINGTNFSLTDNKLVRGANIYRLKILLSNGKIIYSNPEAVYYFENTDYLLFPNPVPAQSKWLQVLSRDLLRGEILIYHVSGQMVLRRPLYSLSESISLNHLQKGLYVVQIRQEGKKDYTGKILVQ
jgi:hypothetical protein